MRPLLTLAFVIVVLARAVCANTLPPIPEVSLQRITIEDAREHLSMLAADSMMGRNTPSPELDVAAQYIAARFKEYGLKPIGGSYIHSYGISRLNLGSENEFKIIHDSTSSGTLMELKSDWIPYDFTADTTVTAEIVFAGYGITAPEFQYDDYANIDVKGKFVFVLRHEPDEKGADTLYFRGKKWTRYSEVRSKMRNAMEHGAIGIIAVTDPVNHMHLKPEGYPWPSLFFKDLRPNDLPISLPGVKNKSILAIHAGERTMVTLFGSIDSLIHIQKRIDSLRQPNSFALTGALATIKVSLEQSRLEAPNVVGWLQGERRDSEHVVIGAHFDHVGVTRATEPNQDTIYNGADDNASGTTGMLEVARAFSAAPHPPRNSVLFIAFSGEEKGLFGSRAYVEHPAVTLTHCAAMLNMDMIGRNDPDSVELGGATHAPELAADALERNTDIGMKIKQSDDFIGRSDQASFSKEHIPVLFFFTGEHADYHKPGDSIDKINFEKVTRISRWCFEIAWDASQREERFSYKETPK